MAYDSIEAIKIARDSGQLVDARAAASAVTAFLDARHFSGRTEGGVRFSGAGYDAGFAIAMNLISETDILAWVDARARAHAVDAFENIQAGQNFEFGLARARKRLNGGNAGDPPPRQDGDPGAQLPPQEGKANGRHRRGRDFKGLISSAAFLASRVPPAYLVDGLLLKGSTYLLTGNTGHCKTLLALLLAIRVATGGGFFGKDCKKGTVAFMAGENSENVKAQFYSMCAELGIDGPSLPILWHEGVFSIKDAEQRLRADLVAHPDLALVIYDSLQAFFEGDDDNDNVEALETIVRVRALTEGHVNRPVNLILAHPVKKASKDNLLPRGGSSAVNESDGNFASWVADGIGEFHWQGKLRGMPFDPIEFEPVLIKPQGLVDDDGKQMPCTVIRPVGPIRKAEIRATIDQRRTAIMKAIEANPMISQNELAPILGAARKTIQDDFKALKDDKLIEPMGKGWRLTKKGKEVLEMEEENG